MNAYGIVAAGPLYVGSIGLIVPTVCARERDYVCVFNVYDIAEAKWFVTRLETDNNKSKYEILRHGQEDKHVLAYCNNLPHCVKKRVVAGRIPKSL